MGRRVGADAVTSDDRLQDLLARHALCDWACEDRDILASLLETRAVLRWYVEGEKKARAWVVELGVVFPPEPGSSAAWAEAAYNNARRVLGDDDAI